MELSNVYLWAKFNTITLHLGIKKELDTWHHYVKRLWALWLIDVIYDTVSYFVATGKKSPMVGSENDEEGIKSKHGVSLLTSVYSALTAAGIIMDCHIGPPGGVLVLIYTSTKCHPVPHIPRPAAKTGGMGREMLHAPCWNGMLIASKQGLLCY
jgi:hypothetical protein